MVTRSPLTVNTDHCSRSSASLATLCLQSLTLLVSNGLKASGENNSDVSGRSYFRNNRSLLNSQYTNSRHVTHRVNLEADSYMLLPTTFEPATEGTFTFRVLTRASAKLRSVDVTPAIIKTAIVKAPAALADAKGFEQYDAVFQQLCDDRKTINSFELQELLETCLPNGKILIFLLT